MRKLRTNSGETVPDPHFVDQVRDIVHKYWKQVTIVEHNEFVEVHLHEAGWSKLQKKDNVIEDLEEEGFLVQKHASKWKLNIWLPSEHDQGEWEG